MLQHISISWQKSYKDRLSFRVTAHEYKRRKLDAYRLTPTSLRSSPLSPLRAWRGFLFFFQPSLRRSRREGGSAKHRPGESTIRLAFPSKHRGQASALNPSTALRETATFCNIINTPCLIMDYYSTSLAEALKHGLQCKPTK